MPRSILVIALIALASLFLAPMLARAEKVNMSPAALQKTATHVVVGSVQNIYTRVATEGNWEVTHYVAEVKIDTIEKGEGLAPKQLVYSRYWTRRWTSRLSKQPPSTSGHRGLPKKGERLRIYLAQDAYNGFGNGNRDGGYDVIGANGFERLKVKELLK